MSSHQLVATMTIDYPRSNSGNADEIGGCVTCKQLIFRHQTWGRAPKPLLGKAHTWCGGR